MKDFLTQFFINFLAVCFMQLTVSSCIPADVKGNANTVFFDLKAFLDKQAQYLAEEKLTLHKTIQTSNQIDSIQCMTNTIDWKKEFAFFYNADINTPTLRDSYKVEKTPTTWTFVALESDLKIQTLQLDFEDEKVKNLYILEQVTNHLFQNQRILKMSLQDEKLVNYSIMNTENMQLMNENTIEVQAHIQR